MTTHYNLGNIRTLLTEGFSEEELRSFCFDRPDFRPLYNQLSEVTGKSQIVHQLVEYADRKELFGPLLTWAEEQNPSKYKKHQPYHPTPLSTTPKPSTADFLELYKKTGGILGTGFSGVDLNISSTLRNSSSFPEANPNKPPPSQELKSIPKVDMNKIVLPEQIPSSSEGRLILRYPDYIFLTSAYGKGALSNPQPFIDVTANLMKHTNLKYGKLESQQLVTVDAYGKPKETIYINDKYLSVSQKTQRIAILPDMLFTVLVRGIDYSKNQLRYAVLSILGDRISVLIKVIEDGQLLDTLPIEAQILYQDKDLPVGNELKKLAKDYHFNISKVQLELGKAIIDSSKKSFLSRVFDFWK